ERLLRDSRFAKCHRSYIVNLNEIAVVSNREIAMKNGAKIPISRGYSQVKDEMLKWMFKKK
ncbi:MAG: LytTR family transcriptional regulator DNA-binding domain-containing protein, partial [Fibromonadales bacterium]|nr:LytTR family transcriptional regulator DNA-binding domain-containing protein [Fibromonadales bacterium]